jgi:hypothetical protein
MHHFLHPEQQVAEMARVCRPEGRVVVSDMVATSTEARERFDEVHRNLDPSHARTLLEAELADLLRSTVGPIAYGETTDPLKIPVEHILTDAADRDAVTSALQAELDGGTATGFEPVVEDGQTLVSFTSTVARATRT